jgi:FlaA1/EpsC-like NDP-sugar epimerase
VFHAAAYKHVPLMEDSPQEAVRTNVLGTYNIAQLCHEFNVKKMVLVSTDKAVRPTNVMGATKYYAETIIRHFAKLSKTTSYGAVRFGNVLASNGSVIPLFQKQIESGGPITVTDPNITRFFMTIPEAVGLILQSGVYAKDGEIFVLDMGKPVKIVDLAEKMIRQSGYLPYDEIRIEFTGLRPGEKMYEELLLDPSTNLKTPNEKIFIDRTEHSNFNQHDFDEMILAAMTNQPHVPQMLFKQIQIKE